MLPASGQLLVSSAMEVPPPVVHRCAHNYVRYVAGFVVLAVHYVVGRGTDYWKVGGVPGVKGRCAHSYVRFVLDNGELAVGYDWFKVPVSSF